MKRTIALLVVPAVMLISSCGLHQSPTGPEESTQPSTGQGLIAPGAALDSARLFLHVGQANGQSIITHPLHQSWDETTVTWNAVGAGLSPFVVATFLPLDTGWVSSDVSGLVGAWLDGIWENHGIVLDQNPPEFQRTRFHSRENGARSPRLVLYCSSADSSPVYTLSPVADAYIHEDQPEMNAGSDTALYSGAIELDSGEHRALIRFDLTEPPPVSTLGDRTWHDLNANGIQEAEEPGLPGVGVRLYNCDLELQGETESDAEGVYSFPSLPAGQYVIEFEPPADHLISPQGVGTDSEADSDADPATGRTSCIELPEGSDDASYDAGFYVPEPEPEPSSIGDRVWHDLNQDGIQDEGEPGLQGIRVRLYNCDLVLQDETETDATGFYAFELLPAGQYVIEFEPPADHLISPQAAGTDSEADSDADPATGRTSCIELPEGSDDASYDAGFYVPEPEPEPSSIGDRVWHDLNQDGIQDEGEPGLQGIRVRLYNCDLMLQDETETDATGFYAFELLPAGQYVIEFEPPAGYLSSPQGAGIDPEADSDADPATGRTVCVDLPEGSDDLTRDAGFFEPDPDTPGCTHGRRYWWKHAGCRNGDDLVTPLLPLWLGDALGAQSIQVTTADTARMVMKLRTFGHPFNGITWLYSHLLVAKLNIAAGASPADIQSTIDIVDAFLADHSWRDWSDMNRADRKVLRRWRRMLLRYNYGIIGPGRCGEGLEGIPPLAELDLDIVLNDEKL